MWCHTQTRIEELQSSVSTNVEDLQGKIMEAESTHNSTRDTLLESMEKLKGDLATQAQAEQNAESNTSVAISQFQTELNDLNSFKADSERSAAELVKKLAVRVGPALVVLFLARVTSLCGGHARCGARYPDLIQVGHSGHNRVAEYLGLEVLGPAYRLELQDHLAPGVG